MALLVAGHWIAHVVTDRWWAESLSPAAASVITNWHLLGLLLNLAAIGVASLWYAVNAALVVRTVASVQVTHHIGNLQLREAVPSRVLFLVAVSASVLLGIASGAGADAWRRPVIFAWEGVRYGVADPFLGHDLGVYVAQFPLWETLEHFAMLLAVLSVVFIAGLYAMIGGLRREGRQIRVHPDARWHLGLLLAIVAVTVSVHYLLAPFRVVLEAGALLDQSHAESQIRLTELLTGVAAATALFSVWWALRGRQTMLLAAWGVLGACALALRLAMPAFGDGTPPTAAHLAAVRAIDARAWGLHLVAAQPVRDSLPPITALWDETLVDRWIARNHGVLEAATRVGDSSASWLVASQPDARAADLVLWRVTDRSPMDLPAPRVYPGLRVRPAAERWARVTNGVATGDAIRRLMLAWIEQAPAMMHRDSVADVDWHLDPVSRAHAVLPMLFWFGSDVVADSGRLLWVVQGFAVTPEFPFATSIDWRGETIAGMTPAVIGVVDARTGSTEFYRDPGGDSIANVWTSLAPRLIHPSRDLSPAVGAVLSYPPAWFGAQAAVLSGPTWSAGEVASQGWGVNSTAPVWNAFGRPAWQALFFAASSGAVTAVATAARENAVPILTLERRTATGDAADSPQGVNALWSRDPEWRHLRDSATAAGDSLLPGSVRWFSGAAGAAMWRPWFLAPPAEGPAPLWVATALGAETAGGRTAAVAWTAALHPAARTAVAPPDLGVQLIEARLWMARADSALKRGDLTAFGRAFEELRKTLDIGH